MTKETLYKNPNYQRLNKKRRNLAVLVLVEGMSFSSGCKAMKLNPTRERRNELLQRVLAGDTDMNLPAESEADDSVPVSLYDQARRLDELMGAAATAPYPGCQATVATHPDSFLARELGVYDLPVHPTPLDPARLARYREYVDQYITAVKNPEPWFCPCQPDARAPEATGAYICHKCGRHNPATEAKRAANPYA